MVLCQCPLGLIPHFYIELSGKPPVSKSVCQCPLGLIPHFYRRSASKIVLLLFGVNALSGLYLISTVELSCLGWKRKPGVNALSGLYLISTRGTCSSSQWMLLCVNALSGLYLISTSKKVKEAFIYSHLCQCPLGLIPHFYGTPSKT